MNYQIETQITVQLSNTPGSIAALSDLLAEHDISINAVSVQSENDEERGLFRFTACDPQNAIQAIKDKGYQASVEDVLTIRLQDSKGRLATLTQALSSSGINIDYMYASVDKTGSDSLLILKVSNIPLSLSIIEAMKKAA